MSRKTSVYLTDRTEHLLGYVQEGDSLSGRINAVADRYAELITRSRRTVLPKFDRAELETLRIVMLVWDSRKMPASQLLGALADEVLQMSVRGTESKSDHTSLMRKLAKLSPVEEIGLIEWLESDLYRSAQPSGAEQ